jgi:hypothetical protein
LLVGVAKSRGFAGIYSPLSRENSKVATVRAARMLKAFGREDAQELFRPQRASLVDKPSQPEVLGCFDRFVAEILRSEFIQKRVEQEFDQLVTAVEGIQALTDPNDPAYQRADEKKRHRDKRKNAITFEEILQRILHHMCAPERIAPSKSMAESDTRVPLLILLRRLIERQLQYGDEDNTLLEPMLKESSIKPVVPKLLPPPFVTVEFALARARRRTLEKLDSLPGTLLIILVVIFSITLAESEVNDAAAIECGVLAFFVLEVVLRLSCCGPTAYFTDPLCIVDFACTAIEVVRVVYSEFFEHAQAGRLFRGLRAFRLLRASRVDNKLRELFNESKLLSQLGSTRESHSRRQIEVAGAGGLELVVLTLQRTDIALAVRLETLALGVRMLEYGNREVQQRMLEMIIKSGNNRFLKSCVGLMQRVGQLVSHMQDEVGSRGIVQPIEHTANRVGSTNTQQFLCRPVSSTLDGCLLYEGALTFRLLHLVAEGHNNLAQNFLRQQEHASSSCNTIEAAANLFCSVVGDKVCIKYRLGLDEVRLLVHLLDFLIETMQGPCFANQQHLATKTRIVQSISQLLDTQLKRAREPVYSSHSSAHVTSLMSDKAPWWIGGSEPLDYVYSPTLLKNRCAEFLCTMLEGNTNQVSVIQ